MCDEPVPYGTIRYSIYKTITATLLIGNDAFYNIVEIVEYFCLLLAIIRHQQGFQYSTITPTAVRDVLRLLLGGFDQLLKLCASSCTGHRVTQGKRNSTAPCTRMILISQDTHRDGGCRHDVGGFPRHHCALWARPSADQERSSLRCE